MDTRTSTAAGRYPRNFRCSAAAAERRRPEGSRSVGFLFFCRMGIGSLRRWLQLEGRAGAVTIGCRRPAGAGGCDPVLLRADGRAASRSDQAPYLRSRNWVISRISRL